MAHSGTKAAQCSAGIFPRNLAFCDLAPTLTTPLPPMGLVNVDQERAGRADFAGEELIFLVALGEAGSSSPCLQGCPQKCQVRKELLLPLRDVCFCSLSRSHLQSSSYGPVLSPINKVHGGVNKLPSVNQLVGQPPPHSSAAGPNLGPMGESLEQWTPRVGCRDLRAGGGGWIYQDHKQDWWGTLDGCFPRRSSLENGHREVGYLHPVPGVLCLGVCRSGVVNNTCLAYPSS